MLLGARAVERFHVIDGIPNLTTRRNSHRVWLLADYYPSAPLTELKDQERSRRGMKRRRRSMLGIFIALPKKRNGHPIPDSALHQRIPFPFSPCRLNSNPAIFIRNRLRNTIMISIRKNGSGILPNFWKFYPDSPEAKIKKFPLDPAQGFMGIFGGPAILPR
jgi:hypothetical protein